MKINSAVMVLTIGLMAAPAAAADLSYDAVSTAKPPLDRPAAAGQMATAPVATTQDSTGHAEAARPGDAELGSGSDTLRWTAYREFKFDFDSADIAMSDRTKIAEIAGFMANNPQLQIGLDGAMDLHGTLLHDQTLTDRRINAVRNALIKAGVPEAKIHAGTFADPQARRDRQVEVVLGSGN